MQHGLHDHGRGLLAQQDDAHHFPCHRRDLPFEIVKSKGKNTGEELREKGTEFTEKFKSAIIQN